MQTNEPNNNDLQVMTGSENVKLHKKMAKRGKDGKIKI